MSERTAIILQNDRNVTLTFRRHTDVISYLNRSNWNIIAERSVFCRRKIVLKKWCPIQLKRSGATHTATSGLHLATGWKVKVRNRNRCTRRWHLGRIGSKRDQGSSLHRLRPSIRLQRPSTLSTRQLAWASFIWPESRKCRPEKSRATEHHYCSTISAGLPLTRGLF